MTMNDYGVAECVLCREKVYFPILDWGRLEHHDYGGVDYRPEYGEPFCVNSCIFSEADIEYMMDGIDEYISTDEF
jgi:hypothetical protein